VDVEAGERRRSVLVEPLEGWGGGGGRGPFVARALTDPFLLPPLLLLLYCWQCCCKGLCAL
jgi:hypothetical protein